MCAITGTTCLQCGDAAPDGQRSAEHLTVLFNATWSSRSGIPLRNAWLPVVTA